MDINEAIQYWLYVMTQFDTVLIHLNLHVQPWESVVVHFTGKKSIRGWAALAVRSDIPFNYQAVSIMLTLHVPAWKPLQNLCLWGSPPATNGAQHCVGLTSSQISSAYDEKTENELKQKGKDITSVIMYLMQWMILSSHK